MDVNLTDAADVPPTGQVVTVPSSSASANNLATENFGLPAPHGDSPGVDAVGSATGGTAVDPVGSAGWNRLCVWWVWRRKVAICGVRQVLPLESTLIACGSPASTAGPMGTLRATYKAPATLAPGAYVLHTTGGGPTPQWVTVSGCGKWTMCACGVWGVGVQLRLESPAPLCHACRLVPPDLCGCNFHLILGCKCWVGAGRSGSPHVSYGGDVRACGYVPSEATSRWCSGGRTDGGGVWGGGPALVRPFSGSDGEVRCPVWDDDRWMGDDHIQVASQVVWLGWG